MQDVAVDYQKKGANSITVSGGGGDNSSKFNKMSLTTKTSVRYTTQISQRINVNNIYDSPR